MGISIATSNATEKSISADLLPTQVHGTGFGALAMINGFGDFASSIIVGLLWSQVSAYVAFGYSALLCILGGLLLTSIRTNQSATQ
jgi:MFS-type transporter involved in bile tolerance (Atg22 family)